MKKGWNSSFVIYSNDNGRAGSAGQMYYGKPMVTSEQQKWPNNNSVGSAEQKEIILHDFKEQ